MGGEEAEAGHQEAGGRQGGGVLRWLWGGE